MYLAAALRDNGGGQLISTEVEPSKIRRARVDPVRLDGAKALYPEILALLEPRLRTGALIVADDADRSPDYLAKVRSATGGYLPTAVGEDVELSIRLG